MPPPPGALMVQGATSWLNICQNSLKAHLKYIEITLKVDKKKSGSGPHRIFSGGGQNIFRASRANLPKSLTHPPPQLPVSAPENGPLDHQG